MSRLVVRQATYRYAILKPLFFEIMDGLGGRAIERNSPVLIKPNLLSSALPEQAVLTHPLIVKAAVEYVLDKGGRPQISDSPGMGSFSRVMRASGIGEVLADLDCECREFSRTVKEDIGEPFGMIDLAEDAVNIPTVINLPKLKTHGLMGLTLGVKNLFGCVIGLRKAEWHLKTAGNRDMFAQLLVRIHERIRPSFTILDGILALEGEGPGKRGRPRQIGVLMGSRDAFAIEHAVCQMIGYPPERLPILAAARAMGLGGEPVEIEGTLPKVHGFDLRPLTPHAIGPEKLQGIIKRYLLARPVCEAPLCEACTRCREICPVHAISFQEESPRFDYGRCIRCFCCIEICPQGALHSMEPTFARIFRMVATKRSPRAL